MRPINEIVVHCTATRADWWASRPTIAKVREVRRWHVEDRGWRDIGYHYLIDRNGRVVQGRPVEQVGAHVRGHNTGTIGVSLFGGHGSSENDRFEDNFTPEQDAALRQLLTDLCERFPTITKISGHNQYAAKACPGFDVTEWLGGTPRRLQAHGSSKSEPLPPPEIVEGRTSVAQSTTVQASAAQLGAAGAGAASAVSMLDGQAQIVALVIFGVIAVAALWIMRERVKKWSRGVR